MSKLYRSRENTITAVDTKTQLSTLGSETAPGPLLVPAGSSKLSKVIVTVIPDTSAAVDTSYFARLEGPGLPEGPEVFAAGASAAQVATGGSGSVDPFVIDVDIPVTASNEIIVFGEACGEDPGNAVMGVTLCFE